MPRKHRIAAQRRTPSRTGLVAALLLALALLAAVLAYAPGLSSPFLFDDERYVRDNVTLLHVWPPDWIHARTQETRPLTNLSFALDDGALGPSARGHHLVNLGLHLASVLLLFGLVRRMRSGGGAATAPDADLVAAVAAAILALHPAHSTSVLYIQGRPGLLATCCALAALWVAVPLIEDWPHARHRPGRTLAAALLVALGALGKETAVVVPALVLIYDWARPAPTPGFRERLVRLHLPLWAGLLPLGVVYGTLRNPHGGVFGAGVVDAARFFATQPAALLSYLKLYLWPTGLTVDRSYALLSPAAPAAWLAALAVLGLLALAARSLWRGGWAGFWTVWWLAALAPTTLIPSREFFAERYLTMATPAFAALAAGALAGLAAAAAGRTHRRRRTLLLAVALLVSVPLAAATAARARVWRSDLALWREATRVSPGNPRAWHQVARLLFAGDSVAAADAAVRTALLLGGPDPQQLVLLSGIAAAKGDVDSAAIFAAEAAQVTPQKAWTHIGLARALARIGRWEGAGREAGTALAIEPGAAAALYLRGQARTAGGDLAGARADAGALDSLGSAPVQAASLLGAIAARAGRLAEAERWLSRATGHAPAGQDEALALLDALRARAPLLLAADQPAAAAQAWELYLAATGAERWDAASLEGLSRAYRALGRDRDADATSRQAERLRSAAR